MAKKCLAPLAAILLGSTSAAAQPPPHTWPFDFDPAVAADPARVREMTDALSTGLPALPSDMTRLHADVVDLWFFPEAAGALLRAVASGPGFEPPVARDAEWCAAHAAFVYPDDLLIGGGTCADRDRDLRARLADSSRACLEVEFAETYVLRHPPGQVSDDVVATLEGEVALAGEALSHMDVPLGVLPAGFLETTRGILQKVRYEPLLRAIDVELTDYAAARQTLASSASCFDASAAADLDARLQALTAELTEVRGQLQTVVALGYRQANADRSAVEQRGRLRGELAVPSLSDAEREFIAFWLGGVYWRMRGQGLVLEPDGTQETRRYYLLEPFRRIGEIAGGQEGYDAAFDVYLRIFEGWGDWMDMGRTPGGGDRYHDLVGMTDRGKYQVGAAASGLGGLGYDPTALYAGGLQMGPCYFYGWEMLADFTWGTDPAPQPPYDVFMDGPTGVGEVCTGAAIALGFARVLLNGKPNPDCVSPCGEPTDPPPGDTDTSPVVGPDTDSREPGDSDAPSGSPESPTLAAERGCAAAPSAWLLALPWRRRRHSARATFSGR
jgi:hypothetical protein